MQRIIIDKPYRFVAPRPNAACVRLLQAWLPTYLRDSHGVESWESLGTERLRASLDAGHGVMLAPNHCRPCDPMVLGLLSWEIGRPCYVMASWHLFMQGWFQSWLLPRIGVFSIYREGMDRDALKCAIRILADAQRPLILFPEGVISRTNDRLNHLMEGTAFIARSAAKQRAAASPAGKVVVHPVAIRYFFGGDLAVTRRDRPGGAAVRQLCGPRVAGAGVGRARRRGGGYGGGSRDHAPGALHHGRVRSGVGGVGLVHVRRVGLRRRVNAARSRGQGAECRMLTSRGVPRPTPDTRPRNRATGIDGGQPGKGVNRESGLDDQAQKAGLGCML